MRRFFQLITFFLILDPLRAEQLVGVTWSSNQQIARVAAAGFQVRYVAPRVLFVTGNQQILDRLKSLGLNVFLVDEGDPQERYFLTDHLDYSPDPAKLVYRDEAGWALLRLRQSLFPLLHQQLHFLWPLPENYSLRTQLRSAKNAGAQAIQSFDSIAEVLAAVDPARLQRHVETLALLDPDKASTTDNLRTRYARHPQLFESTTYIRDQMVAALGQDAVELQEFKANPTDSTMYNVVGTLAGSDPHMGYYVICAHYDAIAVRTRAWDWRTQPAPGADDNATGTALVLEAARVLADQEFPWSIRFITFSGEELGLWGSRDYAIQARQNDDKILGVLNFDMVGFNDLSHRLELVTNTSSRWLVDLMVQSNQRYDIGLKLDVLEDDFAGLSDHAPFWARGYDAILGIENYLPTDSTTHSVRDGEYRLNRQYHQIIDVPDSVNWELVASTTRLAVATLAQYGLEEGLPNLTVFTGDVSGDAQDDLRLRVSNTGLGRVDAPYGVRLWRCEIDSSACQVVYDVEHTEPLEPGAGVDIEVPWKRYGEMVFLLEVDPEDRIEELEEGDNRAFQQMSLVPQSNIVVYPNPFRLGQDEFIAFTGLPLRARVRIYSLVGELVWVGEEENQLQKNLAYEVRWRGNNAEGFLVNDGIYMYTITTATGGILEKGKIALVR